MFSKNTLVVIEYEKTNQDAIIRIPVFMAACRVKSYLWTEAGDKLIAALVIDQDEYSIRKIWNSTMTRSGAVLII